MDSDETKPKHVVWHGCYDEGWGDLIVPDAFAHPAKFSCGLIRRIFKHGFNRGWWVKGDLVGDPFAGIGCGGLVAAGAGLRWFGVELEPRFVELARDNFWARRHQCDVDPEIVQGDSRRFAEIVAGCDAIVTSPPFVDSLSTGPHLKDYTFAPDTGMAKDKHRDFDYGHTPGQIGSLPSGKLDAVVTSPPYAGTSPEAYSSGVDLRKNYETYRKAGGGSSWEKFVASRRKHEDGYGHTPGQIGSLPAGKLDAVVTSPPYVDSVKGAHGEQETAAESRDKRQTEGGSLGQSQRHGGYGVAVGNIGNLKEGKLGEYLSCGRAKIAVQGSGDGVDGAGGVLGPTLVKACEGEKRRSGTRGKLPRHISESRSRNVLAPNIPAGAVAAAGGGDLPTRHSGDTPSRGIATAANGAMRKGHSLSTTLEIGTPRGGNGTIPSVTSKRSVVRATPESTTNACDSDAPETYWAAVAQVYEQCRLAIKPGGMLVVVVKDYVKGGQRVPLCDQTLELLERIGYEPVERIRAMLVKETREAGLFGEHCRVKSRKSFFRRLAEKKGSPPIDWEEVLCVRRGEA